MHKITLVVAGLLCAGACIVPAYAEATGQGRLAVKLVVDAGGPQGHKHRSVRVKLLLVVSRANGKTVKRAERYATSGHVFSYALPSGAYIVKAWLLPPVVNPERRKCSATHHVAVRHAAISRTSVRCVLIG